MTHPSIEKVRALSGLLVALTSALALQSCGESVTGPSDLGGGVWKLQSMQLTGASEFVPLDPDRYTVEFRSDGGIGIVADCNQCGGTYTVSNGMLTVPPLACTLVACATTHGQQFASLIEGTTSVEKGGDELRIQSSEGRLLLSH